MCVFDVVEVMTLGAGSVGVVLALSASEEDVSERKEELVLRTLRERRGEGGAGKSCSANICSRLLRSDTDRGVCGGEKPREGEWQYASICRSRM